MKISAKLEILLALLAVFFTIGLTYASVELPGIVNAILHDSLEFPGTDPVRNPEVLKKFIISNHLHLIGYGTFIVLILLIVIGIVIEKRSLAVAGAVGFFLPVFGHFCRSMFFLAGLGLLRTIWLPITDLSLKLLRLGDIVYIPYAVLVYIPALVRVDIRAPLPYIFMGLGILIFVIGVQAWFVARLQNKKTADFWVYRFSRHPQYLGWIIWSYGLAIYFTRNNEGNLFKLAWGFSDSLPFLISAVVIIAVALIEEINMKRAHGEEYETYLQETPFLLPLPRFLVYTFAIPMRIVLSKKRPETGKEVVAVIAAYTCILILLSVPLVIFDWPPGSGWWGFPYNVIPFTR